MHPKRASTFARARSPAKVPMPLFSPSICGCMLLVTSRTNTMSACGIGDASGVSANVVSAVGRPPRPVATTFRSLCSTPGPARVANAWCSSISPFVSFAGIVTSRAVTPAGSPSMRTVTASSNASRSIWTSSLFVPPW